MANKNLTNAKRAKNDEFYTQYGDIQKEIEAYLEFNPDVFQQFYYGRRHRALPLMTMEENLKYSKHKKIKGKKAYDKYDNYDAIEVSFTDAIPSDYSGVMGVPISFLDKYSPEQFEIIGGTANGQVSNEFKKGNFKVYNNPIAKDKKIYQRILIRHKKK